MLTVANLAATAVFVCLAVIAWGLLLAVLHVRPAFVRRDGPGLHLASTVWLLAATTIAAVCATALRVHLLG